MSQVNKLKLRELSGLLEVESYLTFRKAWNGWCIAVFGSSAAKNIQLIPEKVNFSLPWP